MGLAGPSYASLPDEPGLHRGQFSERRSEFRREVGGSCHPHSPDVLDLPMPAARAATLDGCGQIFCERCIKQHFEIRYGPQS